MASRLARTARRLAVERARARRPDLAPESVEVVEPARGELYVVVRMAPDGLLVLDSVGRLVRGRSRLAAVARHLHDVELFRSLLAEAGLERRRGRAEKSICVLERLRRHYRGTRAGDRIGVIVEHLRGFCVRLDAFGAELERQREMPPTRRTLARAVALLNEAASVERDVVREARHLGADLVLLTERASVDRSLPAAVLERWLTGALEAADLPFLYPELDESETARFVKTFVEAARA